MDTTLVNADAGPSDVSQNKGGTSEPWSTRVRSAHSTCYPPQYVVRRVPRGGKKPVQDSKADSVNSQVEKIRVILFVTSDGQAEDGAPEPTLSACSPHFDSLFEQNPTTTPSQAHQTTTQVIDQSLREFVEEFFIDAFASYDYKTEAEVKTWLFNLNKIMESLNAKYATQDIKGYVLPDIPALTETHLFYPKRENPSVDQVDKLTILDVPDLATYRDHRDRADSTPHTIAMGQPKLQWMDRLSLRIVEQFVKTHNNEGGTIRRMWCDGAYYSQDLSEFSQFTFTLRREMKEGQDLD